jgi:hypothetical protein
MRLRSVRVLTCSYASDNVNEESTSVRVEVGHHQTELVKTKEECRGEDEQETQVSRLLEVESFAEVELYDDVECCGRVCVNNVLCRAKLVPSTPSLTF